MARLGRVKASQQSGELTRSRNPVPFHRFGHRQTDQLRGIREGQFALFGPPVEGAGGIDDRADPRAGEAGPSQVVDRPLEVSPRYLDQALATQRPRQPPQRGIQIEDRLVLVGPALLVEGYTFGAGGDEDPVGLFELQVRPSCPVRVHPDHELEVGVQLHRLSDLACARGSARAADRAVPDDPVVAGPAIALLATEGQGAADAVARIHPLVASPGVDVASRPPSASALLHGPRFPPRIVACKGRDPRTRGLRRRR